MGLKKVLYVHKSVLHGVGWPGDVKKIVLRIDKLKMLGFKPKADSRKAVRKTVEELLKEIGFHGCR